jgi:prevent-host-death family protein
MITIAAGEFKAKCLGLLSDVESKRETVLVTKYGRPVAKLVPLELSDDIDPLEAFQFPGKIEIVGDIMAPLYTDGELDEFERNSVRQLHAHS